MSFDIPYLEARARQQDHIAEALIALQRDQPLGAHLQLTPTTIGDLLRHPPRLRTGRRLLIDWRTMLSGIDWDSSFCHPVLSGPR